MCGISVGKCHCMCVCVYWCYGFGYVISYGWYCWYGMRFWGWYCEKDWSVYVSWGCNR